MPLVALGVILFFMFLLEAALVAGLAAPLTYRIYRSLVDSGERERNYCRMVGLALLGAAMVIYGFQLFGAAIAKLVRPTPECNLSSYESLMSLICWGYAAISSLVIIGTYSIIWGIYLAVKHCCRECREVNEEYERRLLGPETTTI